ILIYDYTLTWTREVNYFWSRPFTLTTGLYLACRYALVSNILFALALNGKFSGERVCSTVYKICAALSVVGRAAILVVWGSRTYAVYNRCKCVIMVFAPLGISIIGTDIRISTDVYQSCVFGGSHAMQEVQGGTMSDVCPNDGSEELEGSAHYMEKEPSMWAKIWKANSQGRCITRGANNSTPSQILTKLRHTDSCVAVLITSSLVLLATEPRQSLTTTSFISISGLMTARFLLHLRDWEHDKAGASILDTTIIKFQSWPVQGLERTTSRFMVKGEFGEDPVSRALAEEQEIPASTAGSHA
ncbi:hypothetical protein CVT25_000090, partial [Psilocybe cyanescens]